MYPPQTSETRASPDIQATRRNVCISETQAFVGGILQVDPSLAGYAVEFALDKLTATCREASGAIEAAEDSEVVVITELLWRDTVRSQQRLSARVTNQCHLLTTFRPHSP